ncbi:MAG: M20/M25/M40 family metallo-hydrolase [Candidatus Bathyarchaeota archaeon]|jgi:hypothetical protein
MSDILFNAERSFRDLEKFAIDIGPRPGGSEAEERAVNYIKGEFEALSLETKIQEFNIDSGRILSKKLEVIEPYKEEITCEAMALTGDTGPEGVEEELVYLDSTSEEYLTPDISGKIVVTPGFKTKDLPLISKLSPLGFIRIESYPRVQPKHLWGKKELWEKYGNLPTVRISNEDGVKLVGSGAKKVRLTVESESLKLKSRNVVAKLRGTTKPDEIVVIGGHYDTVPNVRGASDNAGGTALVLELARVFKKKGTKRTLMFIAWGNEEMGLIGSRYYARRLKEADEDDGESELKRIKLAINLDVHGSLIGKNAASVLGPPELTTAIKLLSSERGIVYDVKEDVYSSDGTPLSSVGIPSVSFSRRAGSDILMHSVEDTMRWVNPQALQRQGEFIELFLTRFVANAASLPFKREIPEKLQEKIAKYFKERLRTPP